MITVSLLVISIISTYLVITKDYKHGVGGSVIFFVLAVSGLVGFLEAIAGDLKFNTISQSIYPAVAALQIRHIYIMYKKKLKCETFTDLITLIFPNRGTL